MQVEDALERDPHAIGEWVASLRMAGWDLGFEHTGGSPCPQQPAASRIEKLPSRRRQPPWTWTWRIGTGSDLRVRPAFVREHAGHAAARCWPQANRVAGTIDLSHLLGEEGPHFGDGCQDGYCVVV